MEVSPLLWGTTLAFIVGLVVVDLLLHRRPRDVSIRESAWGATIWTMVGLAFVFVVWTTHGGHPAGQYLTAYLLERSLSIDNVFVFVVILSYFAVPLNLQHRALLWGVVGALVLRGIFIAIGGAMLEHFEWTIYAFGAILVVTALKLAAGKESEVEPEHNAGLRLLRSVAPISKRYYDHRLLIRNESGHKVATPLLAVLVVIGTTDLMFAVDSIPAVFAVTRDSFIVFTANAFSLLGMRALATLLGQAMDRVVYLKSGLALILALVGIKMLLSDVWHPPTWVPLLGVVVILSATVLLSLISTRPGSRLSKEQLKS